MKYFIDTEFLEGTQRESFPINLFRKNTPPTIDLISIGIVAEDGREYYAISKDFNLKEAWNRFDLKTSATTLNDRKVYWLRQNVLLPIWRNLFSRADSCSGMSNRQSMEFDEDVEKGLYDRHFTFESFKYMIKRFGKTNKEIAIEVKDFCSIGTAYSSTDRSIASVMRFSELDADTLAEIKKHNLTEVYSEVPEFYAYYADYDWVAFCWLFGKMMDLPEGFPMYCNDLKQMLDEKLTGDMIRTGQTLNPNELVELRNMSDKDARLSWIKKHSKHYPKQTNEHNALDDARWNKKLHEFLNQL